MTSNRPVRVSSTPTATGAVHLHEPAANCVQAAVRTRWTAVALISVGFSVLTFSWFLIVPALPGVTTSLDLNDGEQALLVSVFFFGYAASHIPMGFFAAHWGPRRVFLAGLWLLAAVTATSALAPDYLYLVAIRTVGGAAAGAVAGTGFQLGAAWVTPAERKRALGVIGGPGFATGAASATFLWVYVDNAVGWRTGTLIGAGVCAVATGVCALFLRSPVHVDGLNGHTLTFAGVRRMLGSRDLWALGIGTLGGYGLFFTISEDGPSYAVEHLGVSPARAGALSAVVLLAGIPGAVVGGLIADKARRFVAAAAVPVAVTVLATFVLPFSHGFATWVLEGVVGFSLLCGFTPVSSAPAEYEGMQPQDYAIGVGLIVTIANIGAIIDPLVLSSVQGSAGTTAGWLVLASIGAVSWLAFFAAREPRRRTRQVGRAAERAIDICSDVSARSPADLTAI